MSRWIAGLLFAVLFAGFAIAQMPLAAVAGWAGLEAQGVRYATAEGTIWNGRLTGVSSGPLHLGTVHLSSQPLDLLMGKASVAVRFNGAGLRGQGILAAGVSGDLSLRDADVTVGLAHMPTIVPLSGTLRLTGVSLALGPRGCAAVAGDIKTDLTIHYTDKDTWSGPQLAGQLDCVDGDLRIPLAGAARGDKIAAELLFKRDLKSYTAQVDVNTEKPQIQQAMALVGFDRTGNDFTFRQNGRLAGIAR